MKIMLAFLTISVSTHAYTQFQDVVTPFNFDGSKKQTIRVKRCIEHNIEIETHEFAPMSKSELNTLIDNEFNKFLELTKVSDPKLLSKIIENVNFDCSFESKLCRCDYTMLKLTYDKELSK